jgi:hypothetical protein
MDHKKCTEQMVYPTTRFIQNYEGYALSDHAQFAVRMHKTLRLNPSSYSGKFPDLFVTPYHTRRGTRTKKPTVPFAATMKMSVPFSWKGGFRTSLCAFLIAVRVSVPFQRQLFTIITSRGSGLKSWPGDRAILTEVFRGFPQLLQANADIVP